MAAGAKRHRDAIRELELLEGRLSSAFRAARDAGELGLGKDIVELMRKVNEKIEGHRARIQQLKKGA